MEVQARRKLQSLIDPSATATTKGQPNIEAHPRSLCFGLDTTAATSGFAELAGLMPDSPFARDVEWVSSMEAILADGGKQVAMLYTFRSCSRALPVVSKENVADKQEIHERSFSVLRPQIEKLLDLYHFQERVIALLGSVVAELVRGGKKRPVPDAVYARMVDCVDLLVRLDNLKDMKACLQNDFAFYKRAFHNVKAQVDDSDRIADDVHKLQMFLADPRCPKSIIVHRLREAVRGIHGHEHMLLALFEYAVARIERSHHVLPDEKHRLVRFLPHLMLLLDHAAKGKGQGAASAADGGAAFNVFKNKRVCASRVTKIFKRYPVMPLVGDMHISLIFILQRCPNYDAAALASQWAADPDDPRVRKKYALHERWRDIRAQYDRFASTFTALVRHELHSAMSGVRATDGGVAATAAAVGVATARRVADNVLEGMRLLSSWTAAVSEQAAWKYSSPAAAAAGGAGHGMGSEAREYASVVRDNYTPAELSVLVDVVFMIKSLAGLLRAAEAELAPVLRRHVHSETQEFVQLTLSDMLHRADKIKGGKVAPTLIKLRACVADWMNGVEPLNDYKAKHKARKQEHGARQIPQRCTAASAAQLCLLRATLQSLLSEGSSGGLFKKKEIKAEHLEAMQTFHARSFFYPYLLDYAGTVRAASDLGDLWYREFYLEMTKRLQFPIAMSLPWILTEHVIMNPKSNMMENILFALDIYNDAGDKALRDLRQQFVYDEIEAEANLVFDQLVFLLSDELYTYYKNAAASARLDKAYRKRLEVSRGKTASLTARKHRYEVSMAQRHVRLLGRSIDLNFLITQHINENLRKDVELTVQRFEGSDLSSVVDLEALLAVVRDTHARLAEHLDLDAFDDLLAAVNEEVAPTSYRGRIVIHILTELIQDLFPNFAFNAVTRRFIRAPNGKTGEDGGRSYKRSGFSTKNQPPKFLYGPMCGRAFENAHKLQRGFVGRPHVAAMVRLLGRSELPVILENCLGDMRMKVQETLAPYSEALLAGLPTCKLPKYQYRSGGCYAYLEAVLEPILAYGDLKPQVFQTFRELGNALAFMLLLEDVLDSSDALTFLLAAPLMAFSPDCAGGAGDTPFLQTMLHGAPPDAVKVARQAEHCCRDFMRSRTPLFTFALHEVDAMLRAAGLRSRWEGSHAPKNGIMDTDDTSEFYRLWSALQFMFCMPDQQEDETNASDPEEFGDGFAIAGVTFIHQLGQESRFSIFDFAYHVLRVHEGERVDKELEAGGAASVAAVDEQTQARLDEFVKRATMVRQTNDSLFSLLNARIEAPGRDMLIFHPPEDDEEVVSATQHRMTLAGPGAAPPVAIPRRDMPSVESGPPAPVVHGGAMPVPPASAPLAPPPPVRSHAAAPSVVGGGVHGDDGTCSQRSTNISAPAAPRPVSTASTASWASDVSSASPPTSTTFPAPPVPPARSAPPPIPRRTSMDRRPPPPRPRKSSATSAPTVSLATATGPVGETSGSMPIRRAPPALPPRQRGNSKPPLPERKAPALPARKAPPPLPARTAPPLPARKPPPPLPARR